MSDSEDDGRRVLAVAKVVVTIEISCRSSWGSDCLLDQVYRQAEREALEIVQADNRLRILEPPKVSAVVFAKRRS